MKNLQLIKRIGSVLNEELGWSWPVFLIGSLFKSKAVFRKTHWSTQSAPKAEARYVERLALFPAIYLKLVDRFGYQKALGVYQRITSAFGYALLQQALDSFNISHLSGMERFMAYRAHMDKSKADRFNVKEYLTVNETTCHYILKRCVAFDLFSELGMPELTRFFCQGDENFFSVAFPDLLFTRGDSWENTIAYGKDHCEYQLRTMQAG